MAYATRKDFENGNITICVRGDWEDSHELALPPIIMKLVGWEDGDRVEIVKVENLIRPYNLADKNCFLLSLDIMKVEDAKLLDEDENKEREVKSAHDKTR